MQKTGSGGQNSFAGYGYAPSRLPAAGTGKVPGMAEKKRRGGAAEKLTMENPSAILAGDSL